MGGFLCNAAAAVGVAGAAAVTVVAAVGADIATADVVAAPSAIGVAALAAADRVVERCWNALVSAVGSVAVHSADL